MSFKNVKFSSGIAMALCSIGLTQQAFSEQSKPNILFIFSDDHAIKSIGAYGSELTELAPTPNLDRIAKDGALFRNNFCANSICAPSRACVLTGKHSHINGQTGNGGTFDGSQQTFPKLLQGAGYQTAIFGKWHLKSDPTGFDRWMVYPDQGSYYNPKFLTPSGETQIEGYSVDVVTDLSLDWLKNNKGSDKPFMLMCQYKAPHRWWMPGPKHLTKFDDVTFPEPSTLFDDYSGRTSSAAKHRMGIANHLAMGRDLKVGKPVNKSGPLTAEQLATWNAAYGPKNEAFQAAGLEGKELTRWKYQRYVKDYLRCVAAVDENVGRLLDYLKESGLDENTIVVYSSDQGFYLGEHGWYDKRWIYEESLREPLLMRWPGMIKPGTEVTQLTQNIDFAPTLIEAAGLDVPADIQGKSLMPLFSESKPEWRSSIYYHYYDGGGHGVASHYGVRDERYKLIHFERADEWELFDLEKDPNEVNSVYDNPEYNSIRERMNDELDSLRKQYNWKPIARKKKRKTKKK